MKKYCLGRQELGRKVACLEISVNLNHSTPAVTNSVSNEVVVNACMSKPRIRNILFQGVDARLRIFQNLEGDGLEDIQFL